VFAQVPGSAPVLTWVTLQPILRFYSLIEQCPGLHWLLFSLVQKKVIALLKKVHSYRVLFVGGKDLVPAIFSITLLKKFITAEFYL
jgi:hypothetical protein